MKFLKIWLLSSCDLWESMHLHSFNIFFQQILILSDADHTSVYILWCDAGHVCSVLIHMTAVQKTGKLLKDTSEEMLSSYRN